jgi:hypothetical protein
MLAIMICLTGTSSSAQTTALNRLMRQKLELAQGLLAAVVTTNWPEMQRRGETLMRLTNDPAWAALKGPEYARQSQAFLTAAQDLVEAAKRRDLEAAPLAYVSLTLSCVQCHRYVARARVAESSSATSTFVRRADAHQPGSRSNESEPRN